MIPIVNVKKLRCTIGFLAILLPIIVAVLLWRIPPSISSTYYTYEAGPVFMIILGTASVFLMYYDGYDKIDDVLNTIAGVFGLVICIFPCHNDSLSYVGTFQVPVEISATIHNVSAIAFFALLSYVSMFQFTKHGDKEMTRQKKARNVIYRVCGVGMVASFLIMLLPEFHIQIWLVETIALFFFGVSWLTKSNAYKILFADKK